MCIALTLTALSETCSQKGIADMRKRQATLGGIDQTASATGGVQAYSTTVTYTSWTFYATAMPETTTLASSEVTTSTVITVFASDSFHALNSLLSAGQSVINSASSAAAQALATASLPASIEASTTADSTMPPSTSVSSPTSTSSIILSSSSTTASAQTGAASVGAARHDQRVILALAVVLANI